MKNLFSYKDFIGEAKKAATPLSLFKKDVENIISDMFLQAKKPKYEYDDEGFPTSVEFEVVYNDWFCKYDDELKNEFTEGVLKKRDFEPSLVYSSKDQEGKDKDKDKNKYTLKFKIKKIKVDKEALEKGEEKKRSEQFERDSDDQLLKKLKSKKISDANKERIMDILKDRGVEYKNPFEEEDEDEMSEEEMAKQAEKAAKSKEKKNESFLNEGHMSNIHIIANEAGSFENFRIEMMKEYPDLFKKSMEEQEQLNDWLETVYEESIEDEGITEKKKDCGCGKPKATENEKCEKCGKEECECGCECGEPKGKCECGKPDCIKCNESLNEGFLGKIAKFLSKKEYEKAVNHVYDSCDGECTKEKVKDALKGMLFDKITKKKLEEDGKLMSSLIDEIYKDVKKKMDTKESFGSKEWQEKLFKIFEHKMHRNQKDILNYIKDLSENKNFIFIDTETTGLGGFKKQQLTQISAIAYDYNFDTNKLEEIDRYNNKIKLEKDILKRKETEEGRKQLNWVLSFNRYGERNKKYEDEKSTLVEFFEWIDSHNNPLLIMQNAEFDMNMLCGRAGIKLKHEVLDTKQLLQLFVIPITQKLAETDDKYKKELDEIGTSNRDFGLISSSMGKWGPYFKIDMSGYHDSLVDCQLTSSMFLEMINYIKKYNDIDISKYQTQRIKINK